MHLHQLLNHPPALKTYKMIQKTFKFNNFLISNIFMSIKELQKLPYFYLFISLITNGSLLSSLYCGMLGLSIFYFFQS